VAALIREETSKQEARLLSAGHQVVNLRLRAGSGAAGAVADQLDGLGQLAFLRRLKAGMEMSPGRVLDDLRELRSCLLDASRVIRSRAGG
jgi:Zn-dependent M16 (insulinase) family peptidase